MSSFTRDRGSVGRRLWRRRKVRGRAIGTRSDDGEDSGPQVPPQTEARSAGDGAHTAAAADVGSTATRSAEPHGLSADELAAARPRGVVGKLRALFARPPAAERAAHQAAHAAEGARATSGPAGLTAREAAVQAILAVPRGAARLDAFEDAVQRLDGDAAAAPVLHRIAVAFHDELTALAAGAQIDLSVLEGRAEACARALVAAGEDALAGTLLVKIGRRHQALARFVAAGAIDALEEAHAEIRYAEGGAKAEARLLFERFESLFSAGMRAEGLALLEEAVRLWPENNVYRDIRSGVVQRLAGAHVLHLRGAGQTLTLLRKWPLVIGRGEGADVRLEVLTLSRAHARLALVEAVDAGRVMLEDLNTPAGTWLDGSRINHAVEIVGAHTVVLGATPLQVQRREHAVEIQAAHLPRHVTVALVPRGPALGGQTVVDAPGGTLTSAVGFDPHGRAFVQARVALQLNGAPVRRNTLLLHGDVLAMAQEAPMTVVGRLDAR